MLQQHIDSKLLDRFRGTSFSLVLVELMFAQRNIYTRFFTTFLEFNNSIIYIHYI